jgi:hypothetical protein
MAVIVSFVLLLDDDRLVPRVTTTLENSGLHYLSGVRVDLDCLARKEEEAESARGWEER